MYQRPETSTFTPSRLPDSRAALAFMRSSPAYWTVPRFKGSGDAAAHGLGLEYDVPLTQPFGQPTAL